MSWFAWVQLRHLLGSRVFSAKTRVVGHSTPTPVHPLLCSCVLYFSHVKPFPLNSWDFIHIIASACTGPPSISYSRPLSETNSPILWTSGSFPSCPRDCDLEHCCLLEHVSALGPFFSNDRFYCLPLPSIVCFWAVLFVVISYLKWPLPVTQPLLDYLFVGPHPPPHHVQNELSCSLYLQWLALGLAHSITQVVQQMND